jgi:hypothetical protein
LGAVFPGCQPPPVPFEDNPAGEGEAMISAELLEILACPQCKGPVRLTEKNDGLVCDKCRLLYEIREDIPIMLIDEARKLDEHGQGSGKR